ncbi:hypothetical protein AAE478_002281 [Parahypoxylon ruwenzoriense]
MAVDEEASLWPTENLLLKEDRKHYHTSVSPIHWQLRSLVSAEQQDIVYFPAGVNNTHITRLHTTTRECETIKVINFHPRCLVASEGWICCGGENGEFVVIRDAARTDDAHSYNNLDSGDLRSTLSSLESSSNMPEGSMSQLHRDMLSLVERINGSNRAWSASNHKIGTERVNCITIWHPPKGKSEQVQYSSPVAVLANNDKSVTIVGLYEPDMPLDELHYPDCVNRGVISPDGSLLIAICDDPFLYVHAREQATVYHRDRLRETFEWVQLPRIRLKGQWYQDTTDCRGSFAACFSPSGRYLAVGTQYGTISIFDAVALKDPDSEPLITYFNSDRSPGESGAVRDMAFSPGPYDLLAWTEHRGRIGVADARTDFRQRQIISLDTHENFDHFSLNDRSTIDPRLLDPRNERDTGNYSSLQSLLSQSISNHAPPNAGSPDPTSQVNQPFSAEEIAILEAMQSNRRRRESRERGEQRDQRPAESQSQQPAGGLGAWRPPGWERVSARRMVSLLQRIREEDGLRRRTTLTDVQRETLARILERERMLGNRGSHRSGSSQTPPEQDRERRAPTPRRRNSITQALTQNVDYVPQTLASRTQGPSNGNNSNSSNNNNNNNDNAGTSRGDWTPPWYVGLGSGRSGIETLANMVGLNGGLHDNSRTESSRTRRGIPVITTTDVWTSDRSFIRRTRMGPRDHQQNSDDTAGLTWSEDGRILYIGAEDGIYEFHVNVQGRKMFPDVTLR